MFVCKRGFYHYKIRGSYIRIQPTIQAQPKEGHALLSCANVHVVSLSIGRFIMTSDARELC
jgi:hypothetical protein